MARPPTWKDIAQINRHLATHDEQIGDLYDMSRADHETLQLHGRELDLLRQLSETQALRVTHVQASLARMARRAAARAQRK